MVCQTRVRHEDRRDFTPSTCCAFATPARSTAPGGERDHPAQLARRHQQLPDARGHVQIRPARTARSAATPLPTCACPKAASPTCASAYEVLRLRRSRADAVRVIAGRRRAEDLRQIGIEVTTVRARPAHHGDQIPTAPSSRRQPRRSVVGLQPNPGEPGQGQPDIRPMPPATAAAAHATRPGHRPERPAPSRALWLFRGWPAPKPDPEGSCPSRPTAFSLAGAVLPAAMVRCAGAAIRCRRDGSVRLPGNRGVVAPPSPRAAFTFVLPPSRQTPPGLRAGSVFRSCCLRNLAPMSAGVADNMPR